MFKFLYLRFNKQKIIDGVTRYVELEYREENRAEVLVRLLKEARS
jgi:hypothetical protein